MARTARVISLLFILVISPFAADAADSLRILIKMIPEQEAWFTEQILKPFEKKQGVKITVRRFQDYDELERMVLSDSGYDVIKVPVERAEMFRDQDFITPVSDIADETALRTLRREFLLPPLAVADGTLLYVPRKLETRIMVYRISRVQEAVDRYRDVQPSLDAMLQKFTGRGMPPGYALEADPNAWDYYDVLMAGYYWARVSGSVPPGKIGHRGKNYAGTYLRLIDRAFQFGAIRGEIPHLMSKPIKEVFAWECFYAKSKAYNGLMFKEGWSGADLWKAFGEEKIYLAFLTQLDCFMLLGTGENGLSGYFKNSDDVDFAVMPQAASLSGEEFMLANRNITTGGWFWAVGRKSRNAKLALSLILDMTSSDNQKREFEAFGVLSARRELLSENKDEVYLKRWRNRMLQTSVRQISLNRFTMLPSYKDMDRLQNRAYRVLYNLCSNPDEIFGIENVHTIISKNAE